VREQPFQCLEEARAEALAWRKRARERRKKGCETRFSLRRERERAEREGRRRRCDSRKSEKTKFGARVCEVRGQEALLDSHFDFPLQLFGTARGFLLSGLSRFFALLRREARRVPLLRAASRGYRFREESRERERERQGASELFFSFSSSSTRSGASKRCCSPDFFAFLRLSSVTVPTPSRSPTRPPRADRANGPCRWAHGHGRLLRQRRGTYGRGRKKKESIGLALSSSLGKLSRANEETNPLLRHPFPPSPCLRSPLFNPLCSQIFNHYSVVEEADPSARRSVF